MTAYLSNKGKGLGVVSYKITENSIQINYKSRRGQLRSFLYSVRVSGKHHVDQLQKWAMASKNLNTYLRKHKIRYLELSEA